MSVMYLRTIVVTIMEFLSDAGENQKHFDEFTEKILCYLVRLFDVEPSKIGLNFTK